MQRIIFITLMVFNCLMGKGQITLDWGKASDSLALFAANTLSTGLYERDFALSPDGAELFYTLQSPLGIFQTILHSKKDSRGFWSQPEVAPFAGNYSDLEPAFSPDGKKLFFVSNRPVQGTQPKDFDIWVVEKNNGIWGKPQNIGLPVNTSTDEFYPSITQSGNLYFTAAYQNAISKEDIYLAEWKDGKYQSPQPLDTAVNSATYEFNAFVSPDESYILFTSYGRKDDMGRGDLYISKKNGKGIWQPAKNLAVLNSDRLDYCPFVSWDKKILFFTSERLNLQKTFLGQPTNFRELQKTFQSPQNGNGDLYWINFEGVWQQFK